MYAVIGVGIGMAIWTTFLMWTDRRMAKLEGVITAVDVENDGHQGSDIASKGDDDGKTAVTTRSANKD